MLRHDLKLFPSVPTPTIDIEPFYFRAYQAETALLKVGTAGFDFERGLNFILSNVQFSL